MNTLKPNFLGTRNIDTTNTFGNIQFGTSVKDYAFLMDYLFYNADKLDELLRYMKQAIFIPEVLQNLIGSMVVMKTGLKYLDSLPLPEEYYLIGEEIYIKYVLPIVVPTFNFSSILRNDSNESNFYLTIESYYKIKNDYFSTVHMVHCINYFLMEELLKNGEYFIEDLMQNDECEYFATVNELNSADGPDIDLNTELVFNTTIINYILLEDFLALFVINLNQEEDNSALFYNQNSTFNKNIIEYLHKKLVNFTLHRSEEEVFILGCLSKKMTSLQVILFNKNHKNDLFTPFLNLSLEDLQQLISYLIDDMYQTIRHSLKDFVTYNHEYQRIMLVEILKNVYLKKKLFEYYMKLNKSNVINGPAEFNESQREKLYWHYLLDKYMVNEIDSMINEYKKITQLSQFSTCGCCYEEEILLEDSITCPDSHIFCKTCLKKCVEIGVGEGRYEFRCLNSNCQAMFSLQVIESLVETKLFATLVNLMQVEELRKADIKNFVSCPFCPYGVIMPDKSVTMFFCLNPVCKQISCRLCREPDHRPKRCGEKAETSPQTKKRIFIENKMADAMLRTCYKCKKRFYINEGCNLVTCECGGKMCYLCLEPILNHDHFNGGKCPGNVNLKALHQSQIKFAQKNAIITYSRKMTPATETTAAAISSKSITETLIGKKKNCIIS